MGGMFGNNSAGERTLKYGKTEDYILETKVIFSDGNEYLVKPLAKNTERNIVAFSLGHDSIKAENAFLPLFPDSEKIFWKLKKRALMLLRAISTFAQTMQM